MNVDGKLKQTLQYVVKGEQLIKVELGHDWPKAKQLKQRIARIAVEVLNEKSQGRVFSFTCRKGGKAQNDVQRKHCQFDRSSFSLGRVTGENN